MAYTLQRMERDGLIERTPDPADGRRSFISLTRRARELQETLASAARAVNETATQGMSDDAVDTLMKTMQQMIRNLEAAAGRRPL